MTEEERKKAEGMAAAAKIFGTQQKNEEVEEEVSLREKLDGYLTSATTVLLALYCIPSIIFVSFFNSFDPVCTYVVVSDA